MNLNDLVDEIYVINLDEREDRLESVTKQFKEMNSEFKRYSAIKREKGTNGNKLSWLNVIYTAIKRDQQTIAICEDDVVFRRQLLTDLPTLKPQIDETDFDVLSFHHYCSEKRSQSIQHMDKEDDEDIKLIKVKQKPFCNQFLILKNLTLWRHQLIWTLTRKDHLYRSLDHTLTHFGDKSKPYITSREYTFQLDDFSTIKNYKVKRFHQKKRYEDIIG
tara:strand:+ start:451 stop:1104 length:654 start_codon:yes stop_codon:yes gene_type:complete